MQLGYTLYSLLTPTSICPAVVSHTVKHLTRPLQKGKGGQSQGKGNTKDSAVMATAQGQEARLSLGVPESKPQRNPEKPSGATPNWVQLSNIETNNEFFRAST